MSKLLELADAYFESSIDWVNDNPIQTARAALAAEIERVERDAARYRWLRNPSQDVALVLDKEVGYKDLSDDGRTGGYGIYEYRAGDELDAAIDAAIADEGSKT